MDESFILLTEEQIDEIVKEINNINVLQNIYILEVIKDVKTQLKVIKIKAEEFIPFKIAIKTNIEQKLEQMKESWNYIKSVKLPTTTDLYIFHNQSSLSQKRITNLKTLSKSNENNSHY